MKLSRSYEPYLEKLMKYTNERMDEFAIGDYCVLNGHDDPDFPSWVTSSKVYKVVGISYGSLSTGLFGCTLSLPEFIVEDAITGVRENLIRFTAGRLDSYVASFVSYDVTPTRLYPFAESYKAGRFGGGIVGAKYEGIITCGGYSNVSIHRMDKVAVKSYFENLISQEREKKEAEASARAKREQEQYERAKKNNAISDVEIEALRTLLSKERE